MGNTEYSDAKINAKKMNSMKKDIERLYRLIRRKDSPTATIRTISNPDATPPPTGLVDHGATTGLSDDDHGQYFRHDGDRVMSGDIDVNDNDINNINVSRFCIAPTNATPAEGDLWWNETDKTLNVKTDTDTIVQVGQEQLLRIANDTGVTLNNGEVVYISGANGGGRPTVLLGDASELITSEHIIGVVTSDINDTEQGYVTTFGLVRGLNTLAYSAGDPLYLSETAGELTDVKPNFPAWIVEVAHVVTVNESDGIILVHPTLRDNDHFFNGTITENFNFLVTATVGVITGSLERASGGDLTMRFSDGYTLLDTTPAATIVLTAGTDSSPQFNYVYIPISTKVLTLDTSGFPATEHIPIAKIYLQSATKVEDDGALINQNINNYMANVTNQRGRLEIMSERIRVEGSKWFSGINPNGATSSYFTIGASTVDWISTSGVVYQMHAQSIPAYDMSAGQDAHVVNWNGDAFHEISDLFEIVAMADGTALSNNKYFNLVFWMVGNKGGEYSPLMVNVPTGQYTNENAAIRDDNKTAVFDMPREFSLDSSTGFYVCRVTFQFGTTWTVSNVDDLRDPYAVGGGSTAGTAQVEFTDNTFRWYNNTDNTKQVNVDLSGITTGNTRTWTIQDTDLIVAGTDVDNNFSSKQTFSTGLDITGQANFAGGTTYNINSIGGATFKSLELLGNGSGNGFFFGSGFNFQIYEDPGVAHVFKSYDANPFTFDANVEVTGNIVVTGTVDGVDIATRDHAKYLDSEAISALEGNANTFSLLQSFSTGIDVTGSLTTTGATALFDLTGGFTASSTIYKFFDEAGHADANSRFSINIVDSTSAAFYHFKSTGSLYYDLILGRSSYADGALKYAVADESWYFHSDATVNIEGALDVTGNITTAGTVDGVDIAAFLGVGSGNKIWYPCVLAGAGATYYDDYGMFDGLITGAGGNFIIEFKFTQPAIRGTSAFVATRLKINLQDADGSNYVSSVEVFHNDTSANASTSKYSEGTNRTAAGSYTYDFSDFTLAEADEISVRMVVVNATSGDVDINTVEIEGYYT